jgi:hypothetical protein
LTPSDFFGDAFCSLECAFSVLEVKYLGHIVSGEGVSVDPKKIEVIIDWPHAKILKILSGFSWPQKLLKEFFKNYGKIVAPLTTLLKKLPSIRMRMPTKVFQALKDVICTTLVLSLLNFNNIFFLECDAFGKGIGVVLMQEGFPLAFTSRNYVIATWETSTYRRKC